MGAAPPEGRRFGKGQSGNPRGRPKKSEAISAFEIVIDRTLGVIEDGRMRDLTVEEALQHKLYQQALAGSRAARHEVLKMIVRREKAMVGSSRTSRGRPCDVVMEAVDPDNANAALVLLGIASVDEVRTNSHGSRTILQLEPWAVAAALRRRPAPVLARHQLDGIRLCCRDADGIDWPEPQS